MGRLSSLELVAFYSLGSERSLREVAFVRVATVADVDVNVNTDSPQSVSSKLICSSCSAYRAKRSATEPLTSASGPSVRAQKAR